MGATWGSPQFPYPPTLSLKGACFSKRRNLENFATDAAEKRAKKQKWGAVTGRNFFYPIFPLPAMQVNFAVYKQPLLPTTVEIPEKRKKKTPEPHTKGQKIL